VSDPLNPIDMIRRLVAFDTTSAKSNLALIDFVARYLSRLGVRTEIVTNDTGTKANLIATLGGKATQGGVILSGHTDVVPVDGQTWATDPFQAVEKNGRLYGRGTADMKSFLGVALALVPEFLARPLAIPVHLALSYDEEVGCLGAPRLVEQLITAQTAASIVIVGEPTSMRVVTAHKGVRAFRTTVTGAEAHSSAPDDGASAILHGAKLIGFLRGLARELRNTENNDPDFSTPFSTINVGRIEGGTAINIIPRSCTFLWEYRTLPGTDEDKILNRFNAFTRDEWLPAMDADAKKLEVNTESVAHVPAKVSYGSEAGIFQSGGFSAVLCGPGDIADAHISDESISISQINACTAFVRRLIDRVCVP
jgi:acetylornithine deacetylase